MLWTTSKRCLWIALTWLFSAQNLLAQSGGLTFPITQESVSTSLAEAGIPAALSGVQLPTPLVATVPHPRISIEKREPAGPHRERIRLACKEPHGCLPFYALVTLSPESEGSTPLRGARGGSPQENSSSDLPSRSTTAQLRPGDRATLMLANHFMRITIPVLLIDSGRSGSEVRVASLDRKHTYRGLLSTDGTVHGDLP